MTNIFEVFDSLRQFEQTINSRPANKVFAAESSQHSHTNTNENWAGTKDYNEANTLLLQGDEKARKAIEVQSCNKKVKINYTNKTKTIRQVAGGRPCIPAYLGGAPNCMMSAKRTQVKSKVINIIVNLSANGGVTGKALAEAGAKLANEVSTYEQNNIRCNVYVCDISECSSQTIGWFVKIKDSSAPLNRLNIAYPIVNPSMMRRHGFRWQETLNKDISPSFVNGYGYAKSLSGDILKQVKNLFGNNTPIEIRNIKEMI